MNQKEPVETTWHRERGVYSQAFERIEEFVQINIIDIKEVHCIKKYKNVISVSNT